jgi:hypothetical protein
MKHTLTALVLSLGLATPALASAQEINQKGNLIFSAERLMGLSFSHVSQENPDPLEDDENDYTVFGFAWRGTSPQSPFDIPRIGFDYMLIDKLSLGGSLGYASIGDDADIAIFQIAPRVGYLHSFSKVISIWPRGGLTYHSLSGDGDYSENGFAFSAECPFTFSPTEHFAFHVGPTFDIDLFGGYGGDDSDLSQHWRTFGITGGLLGWF